MADERIDEMASTMKAALLAAGYELTWDEMAGSKVWLVSVDKSSSWLRFYGGDTEKEAVELVYAHLQEKRHIAELERENAAMKALIADIEYATKPPSSYLNFQDALYMIYGKIENFRKRAKE